MNRHAHTEYLKRIEVYSQHVQHRSPFFNGETLYVAYTKYKIKRKVNTKYISSSELKTSECLLVLRTRKNVDVFNTLDEIYLIFTPKKSEYPLYINNRLTVMCTTRGERRLLKHIFKLK